MNMLINRNNYEEFFVLYVDGELGAADRIAVEKFAAANPELREELDLLKETVLVADNEIVFDNKEGLYKEETTKIIGFIWWRVAAAVLLLFGVGVWGWIYLNEKEISRPQMATNSPVLSAEVPSPAVDDVEKETAIAISPSSPEVSTTPPARRQIMVAAHVQPATEKAETNKQIKPDLPTVLNTTSIVPTKENVAINVVPQKLITEKAEQETNEQLNQKEDKAPVYEYVDPAEDDMIYVANTSLSKRNKFRGVIRKATRILDRVTSTQ